MFTSATFVGIGGTDLSGEGTSSDGMPFSPLVLVTGNLADHHQRARLGFEDALTATIDKAKVCIVSCMGLSYYFLFAWCGAEA